MTATAPTPAHPAGATAAAHPRPGQPGAGKAQPSDAFAALLDDLCDPAALVGADTGAASTAGKDDAPSGTAARRRDAGRDLGDASAFLTHPFGAAAAAPATAVRWGASAAGDEFAGGPAAGGSSAASAPNAPFLGTARAGKAGTTAAADLGLPLAGAAPAPAPTAPAEPFAAALAQAAAGRAGELREPAVPHGAIDALAGSHAAGGVDAPGEAAPVHQAALTSQPLDAAFAGELAAEVRVMVEGGVQTAELHLNPAELGPIRIHLSIDGQNADLSFAAAHAGTREGLEQALPELHQLFAEQGLSLAHTGVSPGQQEGFAQPRDPQARPAPAPARGENAAGDLPAAAPQVVATRAGRGLLDLYA